MDSLDGWVDSNTQDKTYEQVLQEALEVVNPEDKLGFALSFLCDGMEMFAKNALTPTQKKLATAYLNIAKPLIPTTVIELREAAAKL